eukprot:1154902-Pelagomonas_calceolata.AAC.3
MPLWYFPIPILQNGGTYNPSSRLPAYSVRAHTGNLLKRCLPSSRKASSLTLSAGPPHLAMYLTCFYLCHYTASQDQLHSASRC